MSNKQLVLDEIKQAQQLLSDKASIENDLIELRKPVPISFMKLLLVSTLSIILLVLAGFEDDMIFYISSVVIISTFIYLFRTSEKLTIRKLENNKHQINELNQKATELNHMLKTLNIGPKYLDSNILDKFESYLINNLADTLKDCAIEYARECEREEQMAELRKIQAKQEELLIEFSRIKENNEPFEIEDFKRRMKID
ncbi:hypothetical protein [Solibacillus isronensis]|uniref:hypothetical protein n=1 Tax=Solibacillus isronensis TaxID=412383 RepID=UPI0009A6909C|nr:hypothetical protein [Solibacillus isronensis]